VRNNNLSPARERSCRVLLQIARRTPPRETSEHFESGKPDQPTTNQPSERKTLEATATERAVDDLTAGRGASSDDMEALVGTTDRRANG